jgi:hypothetical protein
MSEDNANRIPAYATYKTFVSFINDLRDGQIPPQISYSVVRGSNSAKATMISSLKSLGLIDDESAPTEELRSLVRDTENYKSNLKALLKRSHPYLFDEGLELSNTTSELVADRFKSAGARGSTVSKAMSFFLAAAKDADIEIAPIVKPPQPPRTGQAKKSKKTSRPAQSSEHDEQKTVSNEGRVGTEKITFVSLRGRPNVEIYIPENLESDEALKVIRATLFNLRQYFGIEEHEI